MCVGMSGYYHIHNMLCSVVMSGQNNIVVDPSHPRFDDVPVLSPTLRTRGYDSEERRSRPGETRLLDLAWHCMQ